MTKSIIITQCLQNDFVQLLQKYDPIPNLLHVGYDEAMRLVGDRAEEGPVDSIMDWAYDQPEDKLEIIHIRDWHDPNDEMQKQHLEHFGDHCLRDTRGADFIFSKKIKLGRKHTIINASGLNDFVDTTLPEALNTYNSEKVKVGIIGVWTEAKISFLAYDLITRYPNFEVFTCSALTASSSRTMHFIALDQLKSILGINIFSSIGAFTNQLTGTQPAIGHKIHSNLKEDGFRFDGSYKISDTDSKLLLYLYRDCKEVEFKCLDGGFSGNVVLKARGTDVLGHQQVPTVIKIGERDSIARERASFERIQEVMGNNAPNIVDFAEYENRGGIKYRYAAMLDGNVRTFQKVYSQTENLNQIFRILDTVFKNQLGRLYEAAKSEKINLLDYYDFNSKYSASVRKKVEGLIGYKAEGDSIEILPGISVPNVCDFYEKELITLKEYTAVGHFLSYIHGDLNGANIIIDAQDNVWIIDFFHTHSGHILRDLIKLENDILFIFAKISSEDELKEGFRLSDILVSIADLGIPLSESVASNFKTPSILKALNVIRKLRSYYPNLIQSDRDPYQYHVAMMRYAMHTLSFDESSELQRKWALYTGSICSEQIRNYIYKSKKLRIDFLTEIQPDFPGKIGITILPGRKDRNRNMTEDINTIRENNISEVICLLTENEFTQYGVENLREDYKINGINANYFPIKDQGVPTKELMQKIVATIAKVTAEKRNILIHCVGGLGRSGMAAACFLISKMALRPPDAIAMVRETRSERAIETKEQEDFIYGFNS
ncbi:MAG: isochorismatase family protein [Leptospira sp.]|nr:isochorismatase family protein [Leptospira sp.]